MSWCFNKMQPKTYCTLAVKYKHRHMTRANNYLTDTPNTVTVLSQLRPFNTELLWWRRFRDGLIFITKKCLCKHMHYASHHPGMWHNKNKENKNKQKNTTNNNKKPNNFWWVECFTHKKVCLVIPDPMATPLLYGKHILGKIHTTFSEILT